MCEQACMPLEAAGLPGAHASGAKFGVEGGCLGGRGKSQPDWRAGMQAGAGMRRAPVPAPLPAFARLRPLVLCRAQKEKRWQSLNLSDGHVEFCNQWIQNTVSSLLFW